MSLYTKTELDYRLYLLPIRLPGGGFRVKVPGEALGSGFFIHEDGYILTNDHVVADATKIHAQTADEDKLETVVVARDPTYDLALLRATPRGKYPVLPMGESLDAELGDLVLAIGNPLGLGHTITMGVVSQKRRILDVIAEDGRRPEYLQTDTAINPGSSGGPLINLAGTWIGVNTAGYDNAQGIGFAVPSRQAREFLSAVIAGRAAAAR